MAVWSFVYRHALTIYRQHQERVLSPYLQQARRVLDFGCGSGQLGQRIVRRFPKIFLTGVDILPVLSLRKTRLRFVQYDGKTLPFPAKSMDFVFAYHVLHHCANPGAALRECVRVSRKQVVIVEPILCNAWERPIAQAVDRIANYATSEVPMPFHFFTDQTWRALLTAFHLRVVEERSVGLLPSWFPIGETRLFILERS